MPPTPYELRKQSSAFGNAARKAATPELMRRLAHYALSLALAAETVERGGRIPDHVLAVMSDHEQLISEALDESALQGAEKNPTELRRQAQRLRLRAEEYRNIAEACRNDGSHYTYRYLARSYEGLAERAERMATDGETEGVGRQGNVRACAASDGAPVPTTGRKAAPDVPSQIRAWRLRAEELRATADHFEVPSAQESLRRAAQNYDQLADQAEALSTGRPRSIDDKAG